MNENAARKAIKQIIQNNCDKLVEGLEFQGALKTIHQITTSDLTPPTGYYYISISIVDSRENNKQGFGRTTATTQQSATYDIIIEISDYVTANPGVGEEIFEASDSQFQIFTDRIVNILKENNTITEEDTKLTFQLEETKTIRKRNATDRWDDVSQYHAILYSRLSFSLVQKCVDDSSLYN